MSNDDSQNIDLLRQQWDDLAASFDNEPDHGLRNPAVLAAWTALLRDSLTDIDGSVLDVGCGTGSLSVVLANLGYQVTGIDFSSAMIARATTKAHDAGYVIPFHVMDAANPTLSASQFDAIVCRHLLWALPNPTQVLSRWEALLKPGGRLLIIEGFWHTGAGLHTQEILQLLSPSLKDVKVRNLSEISGLWGEIVSDERYAITANLPR